MVRIFLKKILYMLTLLYLLQVLLNKEELDRVSWKLVERGRKWTIYNVKFFIVIYKPFEDKLVVNRCVVVVADDTWASHCS